MTPKQIWKEIWRQERLRLAREELEYKQKTIPVNGRALFFHRCSWICRFAPVDQTNAVMEHANVHQFLNDLSHGTDTIDRAHVAMVRGARIASVNAGFKLP